MNLFNHFLLLSALIPIYFKYSIFKLFSNIFHIILLIILMKILYFYLLSRYLVLKLNLNHIIRFH